MNKLLPQFSGEQTLEVGCSLELNYNWLVAAICKKGSSKKNMLEGQSSSLHAMHTGRRGGKGARKYLVYSRDVPNPMCESSNKFGQSCTL